MRYNIQTLSFLVASFKDVVESFGKNDKSVEFYKRQVQGLVNVGQVSQDDADMIEKIIGMQNTNAVKWDIAERKLDEFIKGMNALTNIRDVYAVKAIIENLLEYKIISKTIAAYIYEIYGVKDLSDSKSVKAGFGDMETLKKPVKNLKINRHVGEFTLDRLIDEYGDMTLVIKNTEACCSCDPHVYTCLIKNLPQYRYIIRELAKHTNYRAGKAVSDDVYDSKQVKPNAELQDIMRRMNWKEIYEQYN